MAKMKLNLDGLNGDNSLKNSVIDTLNNIEKKEISAPSVEEPRSFKKISHKKIVSSKLNDYPIENIPEAEDLLLKYGLLEPFGVNYDEDSDTYELESGDRRFHALKNLFDKFENSVEDSPEKELYMTNIHCLYIDGIPCMVENGSRARDDVRARIIVHNESTRPFDAMRTAGKINELAQIYTRQNNMLPKNQRINVNEKIAEELKGRYTVRQIIRYKNFDKLIDELKNVIIQHDMSISEISTYHTLSEEEQSVLAQYINTYHETGKKLELPTIEEIKEIVTSIIPKDTKEDGNIHDEYSNEEVSTQDTPDCQHSTSTEDNNYLEELKATAAKKIKESKNKKDNKINDTIISIQKKSIQLEKAIYSYIEEEDTELQIDIEQLSKDIESAIGTLTYIKSTLER